MSILSTSPEMVIRSFDLLFPCFLMFDLIYKDLCWGVDSKFYKVKFLLICTTVSSRLAPKLNLTVYVSWKLRKHLRN